MKQTLENMEDILDRCINGFHQYVLSEPFHLSFASQSLCDLLGRSKSELVNGNIDLYSFLVHSEDRMKYAEFLRRLSRGSRTRTLEYRLVKKDGSILHVSDTMSVERLHDGTAVGYSVLTDITKFKSENADPRIISDTMPCGFIKFTCEKQPKITCINGQMLKILRSPETRGGELDYLELCLDKILFIIPMEARSDFSRHLEAAKETREPVIRESSILRFDGTRAYVCWATRYIENEDTQEFQSVCIDITEHNRIKTEAESRRYVKALSGVYDSVFEYDLSNKTVKCLRGTNSALLSRLENIPMQMEDANEKWINEAVCDNDREKVRAFFADFLRKSPQKTDFAPPQVQFKALSSSGKLKSFSGILLNTDELTSLFCCRSTDADDASSAPQSGESGADDITVLIRTFGYFDVFVKNKPIAFRSQKSKELFALLVDRRGGYVSSEEAISFLWEDEPANPVTLSRYRKVALRLKNILEEYGISYVVESVDGKRRIATDRVRCDLYDYLSGTEECSQLFKGSYLSNYSWGEKTLAELTGNLFNQEQL